MTADSIIGFRVMFFFCRRRPLTRLFYGYGFGLYGIGQAAGLLVAIVIYSAELMWSGWWLKRFLFGPWEWLWRVVTYWSPQPMRRRAAPMV